MSITDKIIATAKKFVGQTEIKGNQGFHDKEFEEKMRKIGFKTGDAWCSYLAELVWTEAYADDSKALEIIRKNFSGSSFRTLTKFADSGYKAEREAVPGSVVIWRRKKNGEYTPQGHVGIVIEVHGDYFKSIEGNTNAAGSREGDVVALKTRSYSFDKDNGLELAGFIHPLGEIIPPFPFKNREEGNEFREWVNNYHPITAKRIDLDRKGSYNNSFIRKAWSLLYKSWNEKS